MMTRFFRAAIFIAFIFSAKSAFPACHVVTPSGSGSKTGADWNNAYAGLPSTLIRGDVYYLADGTYSPYSFTTPDSGTTVVEIRKAQTYDNCTSTGWNATTMGASQASFTGSPALSLNSDYLILNGNGTYTDPGCGGGPGSTVTSEPPTPSDCGIRLAGSGNTTSGALTVVGCCGVHNILEYIELVSSGTNNIGGNGALAIFGAVSTPQTYFTIKHMYARNEGCVYVQDIGSNTTIDHSYFWGTEVYGAPGGSPCHGQAEFEFGGSSNGVRSYNVYRDITGTAVWTFASGGTNSNWQFYGNIIFFSSPQLSFGGTSDAALDCINSNACNNFTFVQNTIVNCLAAGVYGASCGVGMGDSSGGSVTVENNLWYSNPGQIAFTTTSGVTYTMDYNSFINGPTPVSGGYTLGAHGVLVSSGSPNPFVNWQASDFHLASDNADWNSRAALGSPYNTDVLGNTLTTDRGAYQYAGSVSQAPQAPTGLQATVQ